MVVKILVYGLNVQYAKKWRRTLQYSESHEVPENWWCSLLTLENGEKGSCNDPEEENTELYLNYSPGSIVWAKVEGYPWWPGIVDGDPVTDEYVVRDNRMLCYNVTFLDKKPTRAWIPEIFISPFSKPPKVKKGCLKKFRQNNYVYAIADAKRRAEVAMKMTIKARLQTYSFVHLYKGRWPTAPKFEQYDVKENESRNVEDMAYISLKAPDELGPNDSTNNDQRRIERNLSRKENNTSKGKKSISKNLDIQSSEKKICNKKLLNNGNVIPKNERLFPLMKRKDSERSSSVKKSSRNGLAESIATPVQEKKTGGMKRKMNRKFTPRKEKKFDESSQTLTDDSNNLESENSECEGDDSLNPIIIHKKDDSRSIRASEERSAAKSNENGLSAIPYNKKHGAKKQTNNVNNLNEKKFKKKTNASTDKTTHFSSKEEIAKHIDEAISAVLEFVNNENLKTFDSSAKKKVVKGPNEKQKNFKNAKHSNDKIESITHLPQVPSGTELLPIVNNSTSNVNKRIISGEIKLLKKSQSNMKSKYDKIKRSPKQPASYFSVPFKDSAEQNDEVVNDEVTAAKNLNKENKTSKSTSKNPQKIVILL